MSSTTAAAGAFDRLRPNGGGRLAHGDGHAVRVVHAHLQNAEDEGPLAAAAVEAGDQVVAGLVAPEGAAEHEGVAVVLLRDHFRVGQQVLAVALAELGRHGAHPVDDVVADDKGLIVAEDLHLAEVLRSDERGLGDVLEELHTLGRLVVGKGSGGVDGADGGDDEGAGEGFLKLLGRSHPAAGGGLINVAGEPRDDGAHKLHVPVRRLRHGNLSCHGVAPL